MKMIRSPYSINLFMSLLIALFVCMGPGAACLWAADSPPSPQVIINPRGYNQLKFEPVAFQTIDSVTIAGTWINPPVADQTGNQSNGKKNPVVLFLPMLGETELSFRDMAAFLAHDGWSSLSINLRGHGKSTLQGIRRLDWKQFRPGADFEAINKDVEAALGYVIGRPEADPSFLVIVGAGVGANAAIHGVRSFQNGPSAGKLKIRAMVLLSPGHGYRGVPCKYADIAGLGAIPIFFCASFDDKLSYDTVQSFRPLETLNRGLTFHFLEKAGHGTTMFTKNSYLQQQIIDWLNTKIKAKDTDPQEKQNQ